MIQKICLGSDNYTPVHPRIMQAVLDANTGFAPAYGSDLWTEKARKLIQEALGRPAKVLIVPTGTGGNVLAMKLACKRHESVICADIAHLYYQETGSAESLVGCKLLTVPTHEGKVSCEAVKRKLRSERAYAPHSTSPRVLSLTQPTEVGTVYHMGELKALSDLCKEENLLLHIDGSRFYNAAAALNLSLSDMLKGIAVDFLSLGGTKNGLMGAEALVIFNTAFHSDADYLQKQNLMLLSKMRYLSAQYIPFFSEKLWHLLAAHANKQAQKIAAIIEKTPCLTLNYPHATNQLFFSAPPALIPHIQEKIACYIWNEEIHEIRFVCSWSTTDEDVAAVKEVLTHLADKL